jgi:hypothetical protein
MWSLFTLKMETVKDLLNVSNTANEGISKSFRTESITK